MTPRTKPPGASRRTTPREPANTTLEEEPPPSSQEPRADDGALTLAVLWCPDEPWRVGEVALLPTGGASKAVLGRGDSQRGDPGPRLVLARATPSGVDAGLPIQIAHMSRVQTVISAASRAEALAIQNVGRAPLLLNGDRNDRGFVRQGDTLQVGQQILFLCVRRSAVAAASIVQYPPHDF